MRRNSVFIVTTAIIFFVTTFACNKTQTLHPTTVEQKRNQVWELARSTSEILYETSMIGTLHNEGLDYVYAKLSGLKQTTINNTGIFSLTDVQIADSLSHYVAEFVASKFQIENVELGSIEVNSRQYIDRILSNEPLDPAYFTSSGNHSLSSEFMSSIAQLLSIGNNNSLSDNDKMNAWDQLLNSALPVLSETEKYAFGSAISTAKSSYLYWKDDANYLKWKGLLGIPNTNSQARNAFWEADAIGAAGGIVKGGCMGAVGGPGGIVAGAVLHGIASGIGTSGAYAVWDRFFHSIGWD